MLIKTKTLIYQPEGISTEIQIKIEDETIWMSQKAIAELFQKGLNTINEHIKSIQKSWNKKTV